MFLQEQFCHNCKCDLQNKPAVCTYVLFILQQRKMRFFVSPQSSR
jgi:hypothetical protein